MKHSDGTPKQLNAAMFVALLLLPFAVYWPALHGGFVWDDFDYVAHQHHRRTLGDLAAIWTDPWSTPQYYPLVHTSFWLEYHLWGLSPLGYHVVNVLLHGVTAAMAWLVLRRLRVPGSWLIAAVFALHPIHVESIAWITERKNVMSGAFGLAAFLCWLRFYGIGRDEASNTQPPTVEAHSKEQWRWYIVGGVLFLAALLSKTVTSTLPAAMLVVLWWKHGRISWRIVKPMVPLLIVGAALGRFTAYLEVNRVGAIGQDWDFSLGEKALIAGRSLWFYAGKVVWPRPLIFNYPRWTIDTGAAWQFAFPAAALLALVLIVVFLWKRAPGVVAGVLIFAGMAFPALGFFPLYPHRFSFVADHFIYLPSLGLIAVIVGVVCELLQRKLPTTTTPKAALAAVVLLPLAILSWNRAGVYRDARTVWQDTISQNPSSLIALWNLEQYAIEQKNFSEALALAQRGVDARPDHPMTYYNLALAQLASGDSAAAMATLRQCVSLYKGTEPERGVAHAKIAGLLDREGKTEEAMQQVELAIQNAPTNPLYRLLLGDLLLRTGRFHEAIPPYEMALSSQRGEAQAYYNLGVAYQNDQRLADAAQAYSKAIIIDPNHSTAKMNLAVIEASAGNLARAADLLASALAGSPDNFGGQLNAGMINLRLGRRSLAQAHLEAALKLQPNDPMALQSMAALLLSDPDAGQRARALEFAERAANITKHQEPALLQALAAAYASAGRRDDAIATASKAAGLWEARGLKPQAEQARKQAESFR